jgi:hypothetical protein
MVIAMASNAPDVNAYISEIKEFDYKNFRLDYLSWLLLWLLNIDNIFIFHLTSLIVFSLIVFQCKRKKNEDYIALAALMPMILGSQIRLLFAAATFIFVLQYFKYYRTILIPTLVASLFHFSFLFSFLLPLLIFFGPLFDFIMPIEIVVAYNTKLDAYLEKDEEVASVPGKALLLILLSLNFILLAKQKDFRAFFVLIYILLIPYIESQTWMIFRRSVELILFISYPFYFNNNKKNDNYKIAFFITLYCYLILNSIGYVKKLDLL